MVNGIEMPRMEFFFHCTPNGSFPAANHDVFWYCLYTVDTQMSACKLSTHRAMHWLGIYAAMYTVSPRKVRVAPVSVLVTNV